MSEVSITVPVEYAEHFRAALVEELAGDARHIKKERESVIRAVEEEQTTADFRRADLRVATQLLDGDLALVRQVGLDGEGPIEIRAGGSDEIYAVAHVCETMARQIVRPRLDRALDIGPIDVAYAPKLRELIEPLSWAIERAAECHEEGWRRAEREREAVA